MQKPKWNNIKVRPLLFRSKRKKVLTGSIYTKRGKNLELDEEIYKIQAGHFLVVDPWANYVPKS